MEGRLKFEETKPEMKIDSDPFEVNSSYVEPCCFGINMAGFTSFEFDTSLGNFEENIRQVFPGVGEAAALFEKERMKKELANKEEQVHQRHGSRKNEPANLMAIPLIQMQWIGESSRTRVPGYNEYSTRRNFRGRGRGRGQGRGRFHGHFGKFRGRGRSMVSIQIKLRNLKQLHLKSRTSGQRLLFCTVLFFLNPKQRGKKLLLIQRLILNL
ncbi:hypothetical protein PIB30_051768 [Stylosanthes scabra]|uniref:Uncharacterized protein n=1 Tax=Stylosanthes scabra TaxID=79078 RepID=A0ABU6WJ22_9FABA|nr:hypothetical protein [Stylosanthes scabra]